LPALDDDDYRVGASTTHKKFGERRPPSWPATRLLAFAFEEVRGSR